MPHHYAHSLLSLNSETDHHILSVFSVRACVEIHASMAATFITTQVVQVRTSREEVKQEAHNNNTTFGVIKTKYKQADNDVPSYFL